MIASIGLRSIGLKGASSQVLQSSRYISTSFIARLPQNPDPLLGDYPDIKGDLYFKRSPYVKYDDQQNRRNFNEPLDPNDDLLNMWSPDYYQPVSDATALKYSAVFFGGIATFAGILYTFFYPEKPAVPRNYPYGGLAKDLGSGNQEEDHLHAARIDHKA